ncbi:MAG: 16S rRNA pseudouridine(516) synthase [Planctomycetes bacterium]|nr:16S rRNA pseudouridine(516) synthase [Planctomycetota bacterium]
MPRPEPLDYFLARRRVGTWAAVRRLIQTCHVRVDDVVCKHYRRQLGATSRVTVDGAEIPDGEDTGTLICHKPAGVACSHAPQDAPLIYDLVPEAWRHANLQTVGRLDRDTTGLILFTIDGTWAQQVVEPQHARWKRYRIAFSGSLAADAVVRVAAGLPLSGESTPCLPARLTLDGTSGDGLALATLEVSEGRHHQVKRMIDALGGRVERLHRDRIAELELPHELLPGVMRPLCAAERAALMQTAGDPGV